MLEKLRRQSYCGIEVLEVLIAYPIEWGFAMLDSVSSVTALPAQVPALKTAMEIQVAVAGKVKDMQELQGKEALQLLESATVPTGRIDVYA